MDILVVRVLSGRLRLALQIGQEGQVVREHNHLSVRGLVGRALDAREDRWPEAVSAIRLLAVKRLAPPGD